METILTSTRQKYAELFCSKKTPLFSIVGEVQVGKEGQTKSVTSQGLGYAVASLGKKLYVIATCRHDCMRVQKEQSGEIFQVNNKRSKATLLQDPIIPNRGLDLAFLVVRAQNDILVPDSRPPVEDIAKKSKTYSFRNISSQVSSTDGCILIHEQNVERSNYNAYLTKESTHILLIDRYNQPERERLQRNGHQKHHALQMFSEKGYSGSPVLDQDFGCYGMLIGGIVPEEDTPKDLTIVMPTETIHQELERAKNAIKKY